MTMVDVARSVKELPATLLLRPLNPELERWDGLFAGIMANFVNIRRAQGRLEQV